MKSPTRARLSNIWKITESALKRNPNRGSTASASKEEYKNVASNDYVTNPTLNSQSPPGSDFTMDKGGIVVAASSESFRGLAESTGQSQNNLISSSKLSFENPFNS